MIISTRCFIKTIVLSIPVLSLRLNLLEITVMTLHYLSKKRLKCCTVTRIYFCLKHQTYYVSRVSIHDYLI